GSDFYDETCSGLGAVQNADSWFVFVRLGDSPREWIDGRKRGERSARDYPRVALMGEDFKFQLVLQWPSDSSTGDFDRLMAIEETVRASIGELGVVDGYDIGAREMNIFIWTDEPKQYSRGLCRR